MSKLPASSSLARDARPLTARAGVLGLQGDFAEHLATLERIGVEPVDVRRPEQLDTIDALIIPGGESTTIGKLASQYGFIEKLRDRTAEGMPVWEPVPVRSSLPKTSPVIRIHSRASWI